MFKQEDYHQLENWQKTNALFYEVHHRKNGKVAEYATIQHVVHFLKVNLLVQPVHLEQECVLYLKYTGRKYHQQMYAVYGIDSTSYTGRKEVPFGSFQPFHSVLDCRSYQELENALHVQEVQETTDKTDKQRKSLGNWKDKLHTPQWNHLVQNPLRLLPLDENLNVEETQQMLREIRSGELPEIPKSGFKFDFN